MKVKALRMKIFGDVGAWRIDMRHALQKVKPQTCSEN